jgi:hypothetical protein
LNDRTLAQRLIRRIESEAQAQPGSRLDVRCGPGVARSAEPLARRLAERIGARFSIVAEPTCPREQFQVSAA